MSRLCAARPPFGLGHTIDQLDHNLTRAQALAMEAQPLAKHGEIGNGRESRGSHHNLYSRGETSEYLTRRIARDRPDILERMKRGAFKSVRAAAIEAGVMSSLLRSVAIGCIVAHKKWPRAVATAGTVAQPA